MKEGNHLMCYICGGHIVDFFEIVSDSLRMRRLFAVESNLREKSYFVHHYRSREPPKETQKREEYESILPLSNYSTYYGTV